MKEYGIDPQTVPEEEEISDPTIPANVSQSKRYFIARGLGVFEPHPPCSRRWSSTNSWSVVDLRMHCFFHCYTQACLKCEKKVKPSYDEEAVREMAKVACRQFRARQMPVELLASGGSEDVITEETPVLHDQKRCGMCQALGRPCWT